jgi:predicted phosphodiesterase
MESGVIVVGSDAHYWPGVISTAHKAFVKVIKELKPDLVVLNGDLFDGARVSRWPRSDWSQSPTVKDELQAVSDRLFEIKQAAGNAKIWWCLGNHDMRFETKLANMVPEFEGVQGFSFQDQFPEYPMTISLMINGDLMIKHRYHNGVHATFNNALKSGVSMVTGHLHRLQATIYSDYNGTRWGVDCGTLADTQGDHMHYGEDNPMNHCSGFAVLTIVDGQLLHPEFCAVHNEKAYFRGKQVT